MRRYTRLLLCAACAAGIGFGILSPLAQKRASAADDKMMMDKKDIIDTATGPGMQEVTTLVTAIKAADLVDTLKGKGPFTVFAPTNAAFDKLPKGTVDDLLKPENKEKLRDILEYHVAVGVYKQDYMKNGQTINEANLKNITISMKDGKMLVNNSANVVAT